jgi:hypothetical protein
MREKLLPQLACLTLIACLIPSSAFAKDDWLPIAPEDLVLKDNPASPGAKAMILYREVERDDKIGFASEYVRLKVFTEAGRSYGDVKIAFDRSGFNVESVRGRTIHPDGSVVPFTGQVFESAIAKLGNSFHVSSKAFTMPDVTPGSVIEYKYVLRWEAMDPSTHMYTYFPVDEIDVQQELFQRTLKLRLKPNDENIFSHFTSWYKLPPGAQVEEDKNSHMLTLSLSNLAAVEREVFMPPVSEVHARVLVFYSASNAMDAPTYWKDHGKQWYSSIDSFEKKGPASKVLGGVISSSDSPEAKLRKIYEYVQTFENLSYEFARSEKENKALNRRENKTVEDVLSNKYGYSTDLNYTFAALARAAGFDATILRVANRERLAFHKEWPSLSQLSHTIVLVHNGANALYLDPGSAYCPFGTIPWQYTNVSGMQVDKNAPTWVSIPLPAGPVGTVKRRAKMVLGIDGSLSGTVEVTFTGEDAFLRRVEAREEDEIARKKSMEELLQEWLPLKADIKLENVNDWKNASLPLIASYKIKIPGYASATGRRILLPSTLFAGSYRNPFLPEHRMHDIYMDYTYDRNDDVSITLPDKVKVDALPKNVADKNVVAELSVNYLNENGTLHFSRDFQLKGLFLDQKFYTPLRAYFQTIQSGASEAAILSMGD